MRILKDDVPDFTGKLSVTAKDAEGNIATLPADLIVTGTSDNPSAIALTQNPTDKFSFSLHVGGPNVDGSPAQANVVVNVSTADGKLVGTADESFTVTAGDPTEITVGKLEFPALSPEA